MYISISYRRWHLFLGRCSCPSLFLLRWQVGLSNHIFVCLISSGARLRTYFSGEFPTVLGSACEFLLVLVFNGLFEFDVDTFYPSPLPPPHSG